MANFWKIRHKPTGLFYKPSKHANPSNLSKDGKVYTRKPSFANIGSFYHHPLFDGDHAKLKAALAKEEATPGFWDRRAYHKLRDWIESRRFLPWEWEIVQYTNKQELAEVLRDVIQEGKVDHETTLGDFISWLEGGER